MITRRQAISTAFVANSDRGPLSALVAYAQQVVFGYAQALAKAPLTHADRRTLTHFRADAEQAAAALRKALEQEGGTPVARPDPRLAPAPADPSRRGWYRALITAEENSVQGYYAALQQMTDARHLSGSAAFMAQSGRRLVVLRDRAGAQLLPKAFETGGA